MTRRFSVYGALFSLTILLLAACGPSTPTPEFTAAPTEGRAPLQVQFTDASLNTPTSWEWDFGDGGTSNSQSPNYRFEQAGAFSPKLTAGNEAGSGSVQRQGLIIIRPGDLKWRYLGYITADSGEGRTGAVLFEHRTRPGTYIKLTPGGSLPGDGLKLIRIVKGGVLLEDRRARKMLLEVVGRDIVKFSLDGRALRDDHAPREPLPE